MRPVGSCCPWGGNLLMKWLNSRRALALAAGLLPWLVMLPLGADQVVISEIMYNPLRGVGQSGAQEYEFLELHNASSSSVDLDGAFFSEGISHTFRGPHLLGAGEYLVLAKNRASFSERYPEVTNVVPGTFDGQLSNGGETVTLRSRDGGILFSVTYGDDGRWPDLPDGSGASLVLVNYSGDPSDPASWCSSAELHGSPGVPNTCAFADVVINEVLANNSRPFEDAIELKNISASPIDLAGWYLSDSGAELMKYRIAAGVIESGGYMVFYENQFNSAPFPGTGNKAFGISAFGEQIYLTAPYPNSNRLRLVDALRLGATPSNVSAGRYPDGTGAVTLLSVPTFGVDDPATVELFRSGNGAANSPPRVGPVVINEVMYHPSDPDEEAFEYIELFTTARQQLTSPDGQSAVSSGQIRRQHSSRQAATW
jgi:hypothetical protein